MTWLTIKAVELDHAETIARREAKLDDAVGRALWRMDVKLIPHLAREATRPHTAYSPIINTLADESGKPTAVVLSPLLTDRSDYVFLNFQIAPGNVWSSPQTPTGELTDVVRRNGASEKMISEWTSRLGELRQHVSYDELAIALPNEPPDAFASPDAALNPKVFQNSMVDIGQVQELQQAANSSAQAPQAHMAARDNSQRSQVQAATDLFNRDQALQFYTQQRQATQARQFVSGNPASTVEGVSQPLWVDSQLLLARRVDVGKQVMIQGCWLDWQKIRRTLKAEVADLLPEVDLQPVLDANNTDVSRMLATLPVQIVVAEATPPTSTWSALRVALAIAWACMLIAATATGVLLQGVLSLSERRASFVSAVTHELRTPLTTFRMYSEMLAQDMVPDEQKRRRYLDTLRIEADRLSHLVENVLSYARLERGRPGKRRTKQTVSELLSRVESRLAERASQSEMELVLDVPPKHAEHFVSTDVAAVEQILFNLVDNACKYASASQDRRVHLELAADDKQITFRVRDHGAGISRQEATLLFRPFLKSADQAANSAPGVGLGLALCRRLAKELDGRLELETGEVNGATFRLDLPVG